MTSAPDDVERPEVLALDDPRCLDATQVGHKAANLAALRRLEDPLVVVPNGFAVPVDLAPLLLDAAEDRAGVVAAVVQRAAARLAGDDATLLAVRSSGPDEDAPSSSGAGVHDSEIGVAVDDVLGAARRVIGSWSSDRARALRARTQVPATAGSTPCMAVLVQRVVRADHGRAGVAFSAAPDAPDGDGSQLPAVSIEGARGFGEQVVGGRIDPARATVSTRRRADGGREVDEVHGQDPVLDHDLIRRVAEVTLVVERAMGHPVDVEWAIDDRDGQLHVVQARPIVPSPSTDTTPGPDTAAGAAAGTAPGTAAGDRPVLVRGIGIGRGTATGPVVVVDDPHAVTTLPDGAVLVTRHTDPSWLPLMLAAGALVTDRGGALSHAAIVARELGLPAVVGCQDATTTLRDVDRVEVRCADGVGTVHAVLGR